MPVTRYPIRIGDRSRLFLGIAFGVRPDNAWAEIRDDAIQVQFGRFGIATPLANAASYRIEGPWAWITAIGVRMSVRHRDISFAGSPRGGVRVDLKERVRWHGLRIPAIYYGVDDLDGFAADLARRGIPGQDARSRRS
jgi:hypothetical protein